MPARARSSRPAGPAREHDRRAQAVLLGGVVPRRLDVSHDGRAPWDDADGHVLQVDPAVLEERTRNRRPYPARGAVDVQLPRIRRERALVERDLRRADPPDASEAHHVLDLAALLELPRAHGRAPEHRRFGGLVEPQEHTTRLEPVCEVGPVLRLRGRAHPLRLELHVRRSQQVERLGERAVEDPGIARLDPPDRIGCDAGVEEPAARIHRRLAGAEHRESARRLADVNEPVRRHEADAFVDLEAGRVHRRYLRLDVRRVDELPPDLHRGLRTVQQRHDVVPVTVLPLVLRHGHEPDPARRHELLLEDAVVVVADLRCRGPLIEAGVGAGLVDAVGAQDARVHAVVRRRLVQPDERVRVEPVTARAMPAVDEDDLGVRIGQQRVDERHPRCPRPDDEIISLQLVHTGPSATMDGRGSANLTFGR